MEVSITSTHQVTSKVPPLIDYDVADYPPILEAQHRDGAQHALDEGTRP